MVQLSVLLWPGLTGACTARLHSVLAIIYRLDMLGVTCEVDSLLIPQPDLELTGAYCLSEKCGHPGMAGLLHAPMACLLHVSATYVASDSVLAQQPSLIVTHH